jgi:Cu2+-exporting ATPase
MRQNLGWAIGYSSVALPIAAGVFEPWGLTLRPEIAAITMAGSSIIVAVNALALKRLPLPAVSPGPTPGTPPEADVTRPATAS